MADGATPRGLLYWAVVHKASELLFAAEESGCLTALKDGISLPDLAAATGWLPDSLALVMHLLVRAELVENEGDIYRLTPDTLRYLPLLTVERRLSEWHRANSSLRLALASKQSHDPLNDLDDPALIAIFARAMAITARETSLRIRKIIHPTGSIHFADLGGADGSVAVELAGALPEAMFTIIDRPALQDAFNDRISNAGLTNRIRFVSGDLRDPNIVERVICNADIIMLLNVAHLMNSDDLDRLLRAVKIAAKSKSRLVVREMFRTVDGPISVSDLMLVDWIKCGTYFFDDVEQFTQRMVRAGFSKPMVRSFPESPDTFVVTQL